MQRFFVPPSAACYKILQSPQAEETGEEKQLKTLKYKKTSEDLAKIVSADYSAINSHQRMLFFFFFKGPGRCVGIILKFMLTTTVKIATSTDLCLHLVSRKCV